jgi:hypothetical protein
MKKGTHCIISTLFYNFYCTEFVPGCVDNVAESLLFNPLHSTLPANSGVAVEPKDLPDGKDADSEELDQLCKEVHRLAAELWALEQKIGPALILYIPLARNRLHGIAACLHGAA